MAKINAIPWLERVSSADNISDAVSRWDFELVRKAGWHQVDLDFTPLWTALMRVASEPCLASPERATEVLAAAEQFRKTKR